MLECLNFLIFLFYLLPILLYVIEKLKIHMNLREPKINLVIDVSRVEPNGLSHFLYGLLKNGKIFIFLPNIFRDSSNEDEFVENLIVTIDHELAHYFFLKEMLNSKIKMKIQVFKTLSEFIAIKFSERIDTGENLEIVRVGDKMVPVLYEA